MATALAEEDPWTPADAKKWTTSTRRLSNLEDDKGPQSDSVVPLTGLFDDPTQEQGFRLAEGAFVTSMVPFWAGGLAVHGALSTVHDAVHFDHRGGFWFLRILATLAMAVVAGTTKWKSWGPPTTGYRISQRVLAGLAILYGVVNTCAWLHARQQVIDADDSQQQEAYWDSVTQAAVVQLWMLMRPWSPLDWSWASVVMLCTFVAQMALMYAFFAFETAVDAAMSSVLWAALQFPLGWLIWHDARNRRLRFARTGHAGVLLPAHAKVADEPAEVVDSKGEAGTDAVVPAMGAGGYAEGGYAGAGYAEAGYGPDGYYYGPDGYAYDGAAAGAGAGAGGSAKGFAWTSISPEDLGSALDAGEAAVDSHLDEFEEALRRGQLMDIHRRANSADPHVRAQAQKEMVVFLESARAVVKKAGETDGTTVESLDDEARITSSTPADVTTSHMPWDESEGSDNREERLAQLRMVMSGMNVVQQWLCRVAPKGRSAGDSSIFLGGSCNPTTWRMDVAMPMFDKQHISYYNPQVDTWTPDLIQIESKAKESAEILLFVVSGLTRGIVSMNEVTELVCRGRRVVLVVEDMDDKVLVDGEPVTGRALKDLNRGRAYLRELAQRYGTPLFSDTKKACEYICRQYKDGRLKELGRSSVGGLSDIAVAAAAKRK